MKILRNFSFLTAAHILEKIITFILILVLARYLSAEGYGIYALALSFVGLFGQLTDGGFNLLLIREMAKEKTNRHQLLGQVIVGKAFIGIAVFIITVAIAIILGYPQNVFISIVI